LNFDSFYPGKIYHERYVSESILKEKKEKVDDYIVGECPVEKGLKLNIGKRKNFTIMEGIKIYQMLGNKKSKNVPALFWKNIEQMRSLPERSLERVK